MNSIRLRVLAAAVAVTVGMLVLAGISQLTLLYDGLVRQLDQRLMTAASGLTQAFERHEQRTEFEWEGIDEGLPLEFVAIDSQGIVLAESQGKRQIAPDFLEGRACDVPSVSRMSNGTLSDGSAARILLLRFQPHAEVERHSEHDTSTFSEPIDPEADVRLFVAGSFDDINAVMQLAKWRLAWVTMLASGLAAVILWPVTGFVVRPINRMAQQIATLDVHRLDERVDVSECPRELQPVILRLNEFITRLAKAFEREKQTTANIAHELRTPLSGLVATLELAASRSRTAQYYQQTITSCRHISAELQTLVEQILLLSRLDAGHISMNRQVVDAIRMLKESWNEVLSQHSDTSPSIDWNTPESVQIEVDPTYLRQVFRNLLANALTHGEPSQSVGIFVEKTQSGYMVQIVNTCAGITKDDIPRLKERFFQIDNNRANTGQNAGLGLAIADQLVTMLDGNLSLELVNNVQFVATVRLNIPEVHVATGCCLPSN
ncbi:MAG: ATP-binding protein [Pirellulaceae bacterium]